MALVAWQQAGHVIEMTNHWLEVGLNGKDGAASSVSKNATTHSKTKVRIRVYV